MFLMVGHSSAKGGQASGPSRPRLAEVDKALGGVLSRLKFRGRLMVGQQVLVLFIGVRISTSELCAGVRHIMRCGAMSDDMANPSSPTDEIYKYKKYG
jgi:hypothetical protein